MRIALDLDGVLVDFTTGFRQQLVTTTGFDLVPADRPTPVWDWPQHYGYTDEQVRAAWDAVHQSPDFWATLPAMPGAEGFLDRLWRFVSNENWTRKRSIEVYYLTKRDGVRAKDQAEEWLHRHGYVGKHPTVLLVRGEKGPVAKSLRLTHVVDDNLDNVRDYLDHLGHVAHKSVVLWDAPYNQDDRPDGITVASSFDQLISLWSLR